MSEKVRDVLIAARRGQILDAATRVFAQKGFGRATTREVAREAGVSEGTIYNYFEGFVEEHARRRMALIWENREVFRVVLSEMLVNARLRERYLREVVGSTMKIAEENFQSRVKRGEARATDAPLAMRVGAGSVIGPLALGLLG